MTRTSACKPVSKTELFQIPEKDSETSVLQGIRGGENTQWGRHITVTALILQLPRAVFLNPCTA
jgi:hypothetical protein